MGVGVIECGMEFVVFAFKCLEFDGVIVGEGAGDSKSNSKLVEVLELVKGIYSWGVEDGWDI